MTVKSRGNRLHRALAALTALAALVGVVGLVIDSARVIAGGFLVLVTLAAAAILWTSSSLRKLARSLDRSIDRRADRTESVLLEVLADTRKKQSRHEYHHWLALERIEGIATEVRGIAEGVLWQFYPDTPESLTFRGGVPGAPRVLLVSSNGGGVGHLTRLLAVARRAERDVELSILTLSTAHRVVEELGYPVQYYPSKDASGLPYDAWHRKFSQFFDTLLRTNHVDAVLFDGTWVYRGVSESCARQRVPLVWSCRGLWRADANRQQLLNWRGIATALLVPGEASLEHDDSLETTDYFRTPPITLYSRSELLSRQAARDHLGLRPECNYALIQVGGGNMSDTSAIRQVAIDAVRRLGSEWTAVVAQSPLVREQLVETGGVKTLNVYPLAPYLPAFDFAVTAAGYNSVHESIAACLPTVLTASTETLTDDQPRRARSMGAHRLALDGATVPKLVRAIESLSHENVRTSLRESLRVTAWEDGAAAQAEIVVGCAREHNRELNRN